MFPCRAKGRGTYSPIAAGGLSEGNTAARRRRCAEFEERVPLSPEFDGGDGGVLVSIHQRCIAAGMDNQRRALVGFGMENPADEQGVVAAVMAGDQDCGDACAGIIEQRRSGAMNKAD